MSQHEYPDHLADLLIQKVTTGLSAAEQQELDLLESSSKNRINLEQFELAAAAFDVSFGSELEEIPSRLHDQLLVSAGEFIGSKQHNPPDRSSVETASPVSLPDSSSKSRSGPNWREAVAILVTAASLLLLLSGFNPFGEKPPVPASAFAMLEEFLESQPEDMVTTRWASEDAENRGRVHWSDRKQEGYMVFTDLSANDPTVEQYQLWIFDTDPGQKFPVDGGVFDIDPSQRRTGGEIVVPIRANIPVKKAVQFAVTVERPGGVVVSKRENLPLLAQVEQGP